MINIIITGLPKSGKSTLLDKVLKPYANKIGFITKEIRNEHGRVGFNIVTHQGFEIRLAHTQLKTSHNVGKFFVDIGALQDAVTRVSIFSPEDILYLDEIGQMQLFSDNFKKLVRKYLDSENIVVATITSVYEDEFTQSIRARDDVYIVEISEQNHEDKTQFVQKLIQKAVKAKIYILSPERFRRSGNTVTMSSEHGTRSLTLIKTQNSWTCDCDFFAQHTICSHAIATQAIFKE